MQTKRPRSVSKSRHGSAEEYKKQMKPWIVIGLFVDGGLNVRGEWWLKTRTREDMGSLGQGLFYL